MNVKFRNFILNSRRLVHQPVNPFISTIGRTIGRKSIPCWSTSNINPSADCKEIANGINKKNFDRHLYFNIHFTLILPPMEISIIDSSAMEISI